MSRWLPLLGILALGAVIGCTLFIDESPEPPPPAQPSAAQEDPATPVADRAPAEAPRPGPPAPFVLKGIEWLVRAQHESGGWGAGSHANQDNRDPHKVEVDPATTSFAAMALLRAGHTPVSGEHRESVRRATELLVRTVDESDVEGPRITHLMGTQPQTKLGNLVDTSMTVQFLSRVLSSLTEDDPLRGRVDRALDRCLAKLEGSQQADGSWGSGGWAAVLQSSFGCSALEFAQAAGKTVAPQALFRARGYQKENYDTSSNRVDTSAAAGVSLYAFAGAQRASSGEARAAQQLLEEAKGDGLLAADAELNAENLRRIGVDHSKAQSLAAASEQNEAQILNMDDASLLSGFGSNGGEEFVSYMLASESMVMAGGEKWHEWNDKMHRMMEKIQSPDGSWTGHHCITSPVFCTAAVIQCLTADRDAAILVKIADDEVADSKK